MRVKKNYPYLGDNTDELSVFPVTRDVNDPAYFNRLMAQAESDREGGVYRARFEAMRRIRANILKVTGARKLSELADLSKDRARFEAVLARAREGIAELMAEKLVSPRIKDRDERVELSRERLEELALDADQLVIQVIEKYFSGNENISLNLTNEIKNCQDPAELLLIAFDSTWGAKARFEAKRKLALMDLMATVSHYFRQQRPDLKFFDDLMEKHIYSHRPGKKKGEHHRHYLVSEHRIDGDSRVDNHQTVHVGIFDKEKEAEEALGSTSGLDGSGWSLDSMEGHTIPTEKYLTPMEFRTFEVGTSGSRKEVEFMVDTRQKNRFSMTLKLLRKDTSIEGDSHQMQEVLRDLNGVRLVFRKKEDIGLFLEKLKGALGDRMSVQREKEKVGDGGHKLTFKKQNVVIDGRPFELQLFTLDEFADYLYRRPNSWPEYEIGRFFDSSSSEALFPTEIYGNMNRQKTAQEAKDRAYGRATKGKKRVTWGADERLEMNA